MTSAFDAIILGAGGAGLWCAREAGRRGKRVALVDHADQPGRKLLISGGGRCNFTNTDAGPHAYRSRNPKFCVSALSRFTPEDFVAVVEAHGIPYHEKKLGQLFCDRSAKDLLDMLLAECREANVHFAFGAKLENVGAVDGGYRVETSKGPLTAPRLVVATGGLSIEKTGATGFGYDLARQFGLAVIDPEPALVGLRWSEHDAGRWGDLPGVAVPDTIVTCEGTTFREAILLTHTGLSGPAILQASLAWKSGAPLLIDLLPDTDVVGWLKERRAVDGSAVISELLPILLPARFADRFAKLYLPATRLARLSDGDIETIRRQLKSWKVLPAGTEGFQKAEVTRGGVDTDELSSQTMEARKAPGLFFVGEVVDVTGWLGGYNFQWAWASGAAAGRAL